MLLSPKLKLHCLVKTGLATMRMDLLQKVVMGKGKEKIVFNY
jgi:hypothetical protein